MKFTLALTFIIVTISGYAQTETANPKVTFTKNNYKIQYLKSWNLDTSGSMGTELFIFSPLENETDKFSENVNIIIQDLHGRNINLEKYKQITEQQLSDIATDSKILESSIVKTDKGNYFKLFYTMTQNKFKLKIVSVCFIIRDKAYLATFSSEINKYENYKKVAEDILSSFNVVN